MWRRMSISCHCQDGEGWPGGTKRIGRPSRYPCGDEGGRARAVASADSTGAREHARCAAGEVRSVNINERSVSNDIYAMAKPHSLFSFLDSPHMQQRAIRVFMAVAKYDRGQHKTWKLRDCKDSEAVLLRTDRKSDLTRDKICACKGE